MELILYNNGADNLTMDKSSKLIQLENLSSVKLKENTDIMNPTFILSKNIMCNYVYSKDLGRYYFVKNKRLIQGGLLELDCHVDVLMTYRSVLLNKTALVKRNEFKRNTSLIDDELICQSNNNFYCQQFGNPVLSDYKIFLTTCGGV